MQVFLLQSASTNASWDIYWRVKGHKKQFYFVKDQGMIGWQMESSRLGKLGLGPGKGPLSSRLQPKGWVGPGYRHRGHGDGCLTKMQVFTIRSSNTNCVSHAWMPSSSGSLFRACYIPGLQKRLCKAYCKIGLPASRFGLPVAMYEVIWGSDYRIRPQPAQPR
jgi:hypothetical protein